MCPRTVGRHKPRRPQAPRTLVVVTVNHRWALLYL